MSETYQNDSFLGKLVKTYKYSSSSSDGVEIIDIPGLHLNFRTIGLTNGDRKASNWEMFYTKSIVEILNTEEVKERVRHKPKPETYKHILKNVKAWGKRKN